MSKKAKKKAVFSYLRFKYFVRDDKNFTDLYTVIKSRFLLDSYTARKWLDDWLNNTKIGRIVKKDYPNVY